MTFLLSQIPAGSARRLAAVALTGLGVLVGGGPASAATDATLPGGPVQDLSGDARFALVSDETDSYVLWEAPLRLVDTITGQSRLVASQARPYAGNVSGDGATVIFDTSAALTGDDADNLVDVYAHDVATGTNTLLSAGAADDQLLQDASDDLRYVAIESHAGTTSARLVDRQTHTTIAIDTGAAKAFPYDLSADGRALTLTLEDTSVPPMGVAWMARPTLFATGSGQLTDIAFRPDGTRFDAQPFPIALAGDNGACSVIEGWGGLWLRQGTSTRSVVVSDEIGLLDMTPDCSLITYVDWNGEDQPDIHVMRTGTGERLLVAAGVPTYAGSFYSNVGQSGRLSSGGDKILVQSASGKATLRTLTAADWTPGQPPVPPTPPAPDAGAQTPKPPASTPVKTPDIKVATRVNRGRLVVNVAGDKKLAIRVTTRKNKKRVVIGKTTGRGSVTIKLTSAGRTLLKKAGRRGLNVTVTAGSATVNARIRAR